MTDWNAMTLAALSARYPGDPWDVLPGVDAPPDLPVCMAYPSLSVALGALKTAGFGPTRRGVSAPALDGPYDWTCMVRFSAGAGEDVVLVRRLGS